MHYRPTRNRLTLSMAAVLLSPAIALAQRAPPPTASEWGGIGLLQTPTARMAPDGTFSFTASHNSPYSRYNITMQPFSWLEGSFRYINVSNILYGPSVAGDQNYKDKSIDIKARLLRESRWLPEVSVGVRDLGGTGLFSSEYAVASKNFGPIDASLGLATGYIGNRGDFSNPLGTIDDRFNIRPTPTSEVVNAGKFGVSSMFHGPVGIFGGITYQTPWDALLVKVEYDGNDYRNEPRENNLPQSTPLNFGLVYRPNTNVEITAAWERGDAAMFSLTLRGNPGHARIAPKPLDPRPIPRDSASHSESNSTDMAESTNSELLTSANWKGTAQLLQSNAGFRVSSISRRGTELIISGYQQKYFRPFDSLDRASRILNSELGDSYDWYTLESVRLGLPIVEVGMQEAAFRNYADGLIEEDELKRNLELGAPRTSPREVIYTPDYRRFGGGFNVGYRQNLGGPDGFILFQVAANYSASFFFSPNAWLTATVSQDLFNNYDKFKYDAPSGLPRVRTDLRQYMTTSDLTLPNLQFNYTKHLGRDLYGAAYVGYLEWMYGGLGGELLYRPIHTKWALGANLNWVRQRDFDQQFRLRDYSITTGHATLYYSFDSQERIVGSLTAGRYLAGDYGATINIARAFRNGMTMGAYVTKTNVSSAEFGEGSFDKGIYFSIPLDNVLPRSTGGRAMINWNPLIRDGGAMLERKYSLYNVTSERDPTYFYQNVADTENP